MGELVFVGLGLGRKGVSLEGVEAIRSSDVAYLDKYTSPSPPGQLEDIQAATGKRLVTVERAFLEDGSKILEQASASKVVLATQGDPMIATTHNDLRVRAITRGILTSVVHGTTIPSAAASESGLHYYKFGSAVTVTRASASHYQEVYQRVHSNLLQGQHTLLLLEHDVQTGEGVEPGQVFAKLLLAERNFKREVLSEGSLGMVLARVGMKDQMVSGGSFGKLQGWSFGPPPHCVIVPGRLHFTEEEALAAVVKVEKSEIVDNSSKVKRTAQVLVPRYVEKAKKAVQEARDGLKGKHGEVIENAELYLKDAENFLANNEDELAMLSVGYAEGLVDSLSFTGEVKLSW